MGDRSLTGKNGKMFILNKMLKMEYVMKELIERERKCMENWINKPTSSIICKWDKWDKDNFKN